MADILNKKKDVYLKEKTSFLKELLSFHQVKGTPYQRLPQIDGKEIDLYLLYYLVTANGGWEKVNAFDSWDHLIQYFSLPKDCTNGAQALKYIYLRYLDLYERVHFLGEDLDRQHREEEHEDEKRSMRRALRAFATQHVPTSYNHAQHMVSESQRSSLGFAVLKERGKDDYEKILLSLLTPMPNEQDFAVNLCHMMSGEKMPGLNLEANPRIVDALLAHAGVFSHESTREAISTVYRQAHGVDVSSFWKQSICDKDFLELSSEKMPERILPPDIENIQLHKNEDSDTLTVTAPVQKETNVKSTNQKTESQPRPKEPPVDQFKNKIRFVEAAKPKSLVENEVSIVEKLPSPAIVDIPLADSDYELFSLKNYGKRDLYGFRVLQILHIIRNLSCDEANQTALARNMACIRFLLLCTHSDRSELKALACEAFGNIAGEFHLEDPITSQISAMLLGTISKGLVSQDRAIVLGCLEILSKLCQNQENELVLQSALDQKLCESICNYLTAHDIFLLIMTLECLLSVSSLGESSCNRILNSNACLSTLLSLLTVEAQSFGQRACIGMQVIDANTGVAPVPLATITHSTPIKAPPPKTPAGKTSTPKAAQTPTSSQPKAADSEEALKAWLRSVAESARGSFCDVTDLHRLYVESYAKPKKLAVLTTQQLTKAVRGTFGSSVGPSRKPNTTSFDLQFVNLRIKLGVVIPPPPQPPAPVLRPQPVEPKPVEIVQPTPVAPQPLNSPILKAQLSVPTAAKPSEEVQQCQDIGGPSSLVKSLLANKVVQRQQLHQRVGDPQPVNALANGPTVVKPMVNGIMSPQFPKEVKIEIKEESRGESRLEALLNHTEDKKSVLSDLLEKDVNGFAPRRDVRIGDKGLELVLNEEIAPNITARVDEEGSVQLHIEDKSTDSSEIALPLLQQNGGSSFQNLLIEKGIIEEKPNRNRNRKRKMNPSGEEDPKRRRSTPPPGGQPSILQKAMELAHIEDELLEEEPKENGLTANFPAPASSQSRLSALLSSSPRPQPITSAPIQHSQISSTSGPSQPRLSNGPKDQELLLQQPDGTIVRVVQGLQSRQIMQQLVQSQSAAQGSQSVQQGQVLMKEQQNMGQIVIRDPQTGKQQIVQGVMHSQKPDVQKIRKPEMKVVHPQAASGSHVIVGQGSGQVVVNQALMNQQQVVLGQGPSQQVVLGQGSSQMVLNQSSSGQKQYIVQTSAGLQVVTGGSNQVYMQSNGQQIVLANSGGQSGGHQQLLLANSSGAGQQYIVSANSSNGQQLVLGPGQSGGQQIVLSNSQGQQMKFVLINSQNNQQIVLNKTQKAVSPVPSEEPPKVQKEAPHHPPPPQPAASQATHGNVQHAISQSHKPPPYSPDAAYLCEWRTCMRAFRTPNELYAHACRVHCPNGMEESQCQWERCDDLKRKRLSLMTHLYDRHCSEEIQKRLSLRRKQIALQGKTDIPLPNLPPPHPGYAPNAAMSAIKRHALVDWGNGKDIVEEKEGPLTKSIRLTSALILKNIVVYSPMGKRHLKRYESRLTLIAMSNAESARTVCQILAELAES